MKPNETAKQITRLSAVQAIREFDRWAAEGKITPKELERIYLQLNIAQRSDAVMQ